jgi:hypothetical protein
MRSDTCTAAQQRHAYNNATFSPYIMSRPKPEIPMSPLFKFQTREELKLPDFSDVCRPLVRMVCIVKEQLGKYIVKTALILVDLIIQSCHWPSYASVFFSRDTTSSKRRRRLSGLRLWSFGIRGRVQFRYNSVSFAPA